MEIAVLIPCYNEELTIGKVIEDLKILNYRMLPSMFTITILRTKPQKLLKVTGQL